MNNGNGHMWRGLIVAGVTVLALTACSHAPQARSRDYYQSLDNDPIEPVNRAIYRFNYTFDGLVLKPVTQVYRGVMPKKGRTMVSNFLENLYSPVVFANSVLQGDPKNSFSTLWRFVLNSTFGVGGLFDFASEVGLKNRPADLGETFGMYGADAGPYIELPIIGPSNVRDAFGRLGDAFMMPTNYMGNVVSYSVWGATAVDERSKNMSLIDGIYENSLDPYVTFRSAYTQKRRADIRRAIRERHKALENSVCKE